MQTSMSTFRDRLQRAAHHAGIDFSQTAIARSLGVSKQTVDRWFNGYEPRAPMVFHIADSWGVDARWLATNEGDIGPTAPRRFSGGKAAAVVLALASLIGAPSPDASMLQRGGESAYYVNSQIVRAPR